MLRWRRGISGPTRDGYPDTRHWLVLCGRMATTAAMVTSWRDWRKRRGISVTLLAQGERQTVCLPESGAGACWLNAGGVSMLPILSGRKRRI